MDTPLLPNGNQTNPQREASATSSRPTIEPEAATQPKTVMSSVQTDRLPPTVANNNCNVTINYNFYDTAVSPHLNMTDQQSVGTETEKDGINPRTDEKESPSPTACKVTPSEMEPSNKTNLDQVNEIQHPQLGESPTTRIPDSHDKPPTTSNTQFENSANETMKEDLAMLEELMKAIRDDANTAWIRADLPDSELQGIIFHRVIQSLPLGPAEIEKDVPAMALVYLEQRLKRCLKIFRDKSVVTNATVDDKIPTSSPAAVAWKDGVETPGAHASAPQKACTSASSDTKQVPASAGSAVNMRQNNLKGPSSDSNDNAEPSSADPTQVFQLNTHKDAHSTSKNHRSDSPSKPKHGGQRSSTEDKCSVLTASDPNNINLSSLGQSEICCLSDCAIMHKSFEEHNLQMKEKSSLSIKEDIKAPKSMISTVSRNDTSEHEDVPLVERLSTLAKNQPRLLPILATDDLRTQKFTAVSIQQVYDYDSQEDKGANSSSTPKKSRGDASHSERRQNVVESLRVAREVLAEVKKTVDDHDTSKIAEKERVCRFCKAEFTEEQNKIKEDGLLPCSHHPGVLRGSHKKGYKWSCCKAPPYKIGNAEILNKSAPGCKATYHQDVRDITH